MYVCVFPSFANSITLIWCESQVLVFYFIEYVFTDKRVRADIQSDVESIPLAVCFRPLLLSKDTDTSQLEMSSAFMDQLTMLIYSVIGVVKEHTEHWSENNEHKVCVLYSGSVCVRMQGSTVIHNNDDVMF